MSRTSYNALIGGVLLGLVLALGAAAAFYFHGYRFMRHENLTAKPEREILCYTSPQDPTFMSDKPGKDHQGNELIPVYKEAAPASTMAAKSQGERKIKYWYSPMDPGFVRDQPGKAPCGMDLVPKYEDEPAAAAPASQAKGERKVKYWVSPMDPGLRQGQTRQGPLRHGPGARL